MLVRSFVRRFSSSQRTFLRNKYPNNISKEDILAWRSALLNEPTSKTTVVNKNEVLHELVRKVIRAKAAESKEYYMENALFCFRQFYSGLEGSQKEEFFRSLTCRFGIDHQLLGEAIESWNRFREQRCSGDIQHRDALMLAKKITNASIPVYSHLWTCLSEVKGGVEFLCLLREDLLGCIENDAQLRSLDDSLRRLLSFWFTGGGLLELERVSWEHSTAALLEILVHRERVHKVSSWISLKQRLEVNRRVFVCKHPSLPETPLIALYVALEDRMPRTMPEILRHEAAIKTMEKPRVGCFYSISNMVPGLKGIDMGQNIIKEATKYLRGEFESIREFCTLSPLQNFAAWLKGYLKRHSLPPGITDVSMIGLNEPKLRQILGVKTNSDIDTLKIAISSLEEMNYTSELLDELEGPMLRLAAQYLVTEKHRGGALDPVANFHLHNGASLARINFGSDMTLAGRTRSFGIMCNYVYDPADLDENIKSYVSEGKIVVSAEVTQLLPSN